MDSRIRRSTPLRRGHARLVREALIVLAVAVATYALCSLPGVEPAVNAWRMRSSTGWVGPLGPALLAATIASGILSFVRSHALHRENLAHTDAERALRARTEQLEALRRVGLELTTQRDSDALLRFIVARAVELVRGDSGGLYLYRPEADVLEWTMTVGPHPSRLGTTLRRGEGLSGRIWETGRPLAVDDYRVWPSRAPVYAGVDFVAVVGAPVLWGDSFLGVLNVVSRHAGAFGDQEAELLSMFAAQAAVALEGARLLEETQRQSSRMGRLLSVSESLHRGLDLDQVLHQVARGAVHLGFRRAVINVGEREEGTLSVQAIAGIEGPEREQLWKATYRWSDFERLMQERFRVSHSYLIRHGQVDWRRDFVGPVVVPEGTGGGAGRWSPEDALFVPLTGTRGHPVGILSVDEPEDGRIPDVTTIQALEAFANHAGVAIENARLYEAARRELAERERLEQQLIEAHKMEAVGRLAGGVAHDFNNLLTVINGYSDFLLRTVDLPEAVRDDVDEIRRAGERAADLTRQLLAYGRRQMQELCVFDLNDALRDMTKKLRRLIGQDIALSLAPSDVPLSIRADRSHMEQVVINLAMNARDAMPRGGTLTLETARVDLGSDAAESLGLEEGCYAQLTIRDTGIGMTPEVRAHLFEPFFSTKGPGKGTGLGLATVYGIVKQSGGEIEVRSSMGRGTAFRIYLPCYPQLECPAALPDAASALPHGGERILIVEDEERVRRFACDVLCRLGYTVVEAGDGAEALAQLDAAGAVDLVVTDVVMPRMGGHDLAARLRASRPDLPVLLMSGYPGDGGTPSDLVRKPFTAEVLAGRIRRALDGARAGAPQSAR